MGLPLVKVAAMTTLAAAKSVTFILTRDRAALTPFYSDVLGLTVLAEEAYSTVFDLNGATLHLTTVADHTPSPHPVMGWNVADIAATARDLAAKGITFTVYPGYGQGEFGIWTSPDGASKINWFNDPEGNVLSLMQG